MFERMSQFAEQTATNVSCRAFLGRLGNTALTVAAGMAGILALPAMGDAARKPPVVCTHGSPDCIGEPAGSICLTYSGTATCRAVKKSTYCTCG